MLHAVERIENKRNKYAIDKRLRCFENLDKKGLNLLTRKRFHINNTICLFSLSLKGKEN